MSLESNIADLVSASTRLTQAVNITRAEVDSKQASAAQAAADIVAVKEAVVTAAGQAAASASQAATSLTTTVSDYAAQKVTKGLAAIQTSAEQELADQLHRRDPARYPFRGAKPSLVLDFVRQECHRQNGGALEQVDLNSFMTFTRGSTATFTGPDGYLKTAAVNQPRYEYDPVTGECLGLLVEEQRTNLSNNSGFTASNYWTLIQVRTTPPAQIDPAGNLQGCIIYPTITGTNSAPRLEGTTLTYSPASAITISATCTAGSASIVHVCGFNSATGWFTASVDLSSGTVIKTGAGSDGVFIACVVNKIGKAYRVSVTGSISSGTTVSVGVGFGVSQNPTYANYGQSAENHSLSEYINLHNVQTELGLFPTSYIPTPATFTGRASTATYLDSNGVLQTAASGVARSNAYGYDSDGVLRPIVLLLEGSATNLGRYSEQFESVAWNKYYSTVTANATTAPDGNVTADYVIPGTGGNSAHGVSLQATPISASTIYTKSVYLKAGGYPFGYISIVDNTNASCAYFDLSTGVVGSTEGNAIIGATIKKAANGFYRCTVTYTSGASATTTNSFVAACAANGSVAFAGDGISGIYIWGAQLEQGSYATSYIPTTSAQVTRAADTATSAQVTRGAEIYTAETGTFYNHEEGVLFTSITNRVDNPNGGGVTYFYSSGVDPTHFNCFGISDRSNKVGFGSLDGLGVFNCVAGNFVVNTLSRSAIAYNATRFVAARNNALSADAITVKRFRKIDRISVGTSAYKFNTKECLNGCIRLVVYYPKSLSNTDLQALTIL